MTLTSPFSVVLSPTDYRTLTRRAARVKSTIRDNLRARIVLAANAGLSNAAIARDLQVTVDTVRKWRRRFSQSGIAGLQDLPRSGRPPVFSTVVVAEVKVMACALPAENTVPLSRWSHSELAAEAVTRGLVDSVSTSTIRRWLTGDAIKP